MPKKAKTNSQRGIFPKRRLITEQQRAELSRRELERSAQRPSKLDEIEDQLKLLLRAADSRENAQERALYFAEQKITRADISDPEVFEDAKLAWETVCRIKQTVLSVERLAEDGIFLGKLLERLRVRVHDEAVKQHKIASANRRDGAKKANAKKASQQPEYEALVQLQLKDGKTYQAAIESVAKDLDCDLRTVRNNTRALRPRRAAKESVEKR